MIQILFNLLHNAVKFTHEGSIAIRARREQQLAYLEVEDTGIGIAEEEREKIMQSYEQVEPERAGGSGLGLGLSICNKLVRLHGGNLVIESAIGKGSTFSFTLPIYQADQQGVATKQVERSQQIDSQGVERTQPEKHRQGEISIGQISEQVGDVMEPIRKTVELTNLEIVATRDGQRELMKPSGTRGKLDHADPGKPSILVVDDDSVNLNVLRYLLEPENYQITAVSNAEEALAHLEGESFDLVISDVMMPTISGYELTRRIRQRFTMSELPILLLTARVRTEDIEAGFQVGANDYVKKPVDAAELKARVHALTRLKLSIEERLRMEGAWLQSQIRPHFIYNTLNSIAALGVLDQAKMINLIEEFSNYLRLSFNFRNAEPLVPLEHELALVRSYIAIMKERFGDKLLVEWELDSRLDFHLPPLTIQPLLENAIIHGIFQQSKGGKIRIQIKDASDHVHIAIMDNGVGMEAERLATILEEPNLAGREGIGLRNIDRRLKQLYGQGLIIESRPGNGTTVSFDIPKD